MAQRQPTRIPKTLRVRALSVFSLRDGLSVFSLRVRLSVFSLRGRLSGFLLGGRPSVFWVGAFSLNLAIACPAPSGLEREAVHLAHVHDGDSLRLIDDRRIRLLSINAPEVAWDGEPAEPLAYEARDLLRELIEPGDSLELVYDQEREDHYGRTLAHVYTKEGISLEGLLLRRGLAFHIAIPPNLTLASCLAELEAEARVAERGLWDDGVWPALSASDMTLEDTGYRRVQGRITDVSLAGGLWLELDGPLVVRVSEDDLEHFPSGFKDRAKAQWLGRQVEVRGWVIDRSGSRAAERGFKPLMMPLRTPYSLTPVQSD